MIQQTELPKARGSLPKTNPEMPRIAVDDVKQITRAEIKEVVRDMDLIWIQARRAVLLVGAAALLAPSALTLLLVAILLPVTMAQLLSMLLVSSVMFYAVVELAWRGRQAIARAPTRKLRDRLEREASLTKPIAQG